MNKVTIYDLKPFQRAKVATNTYIIRVPGGWIIQCSDLDWGGISTGKFALGFIPWSKDKLFQGLEVELIINEGTQKVE